MALSRSDCMDVVQDIGFPAIFSDNPRTYFFFGMESDRIIQKWTRATCTIALVAAVPTGHVAEDTFRQTEIAETGELVVDKCVTGGQQVGGARVIGPKGFFNVAVIETDLLEKRYGSHPVKTA